MSPPPLCCLRRAAQGRSLTDAIKKLRGCGFEGIEPSLVGHVTEENAAEWISASQESGLIIDRTVGGRAEGLEAGIDLTKRLGGDSMLVVLAYPADQPLGKTWKDSVARMKAGDWDDLTDVARRMDKLLDL